MLPHDAADVGRFGRDVGAAGLVEDSGCGGLDRQVNLFAAALRGRERGGEG